MRINLDQGGYDALKMLQNRCREINEDIETAAGPFIRNLLATMDQTLSKEELRKIAERLTSERIRQQRIRNRWQKISESMDEKTLEKLEKKYQIKRVENSNSAQKIAEKELKNE